MRVGGTRVALLVGAVAGASAGCGDAGVPDPPVSGTDSAGVAVVWSAAPVREEGHGPFVGEVEVALGGPGGDLFGVAGAVRLPDGGFVVADEGTARLLLFGPDGSFRESVGGAGDGPGEFRILQAVGASGDSVWAYDFSHRRVSFFQGGALVGTVTLVPPLPRGAVVGRWSDGSWSVTQLWGDAGPEVPPMGLVRAPVLLVRYDPGGRLADTLGSWPGREVFLSREGGRTVMGSAPFTRTLSQAIYPGGLVVGDQVEHAFHVLDRDGTDRRVVRWAGPPLAVTPADVDAWKEAQVTASPSADRPSVRAYLADVPVPESRPAYGTLLTGSDGTVWVGAYAHPGEVPARWDAFDPGGRWLGPVSMPSGFRPLELGSDWVLGVSTDGLGVERVELRAVGDGDGGPTSAPEQGGRIRR